MDMAVELGEEAEEEDEETEMVAEKDGTEEVGREGTVPALTRTKEVLDNGTVIHPT